MVGLIERMAMSLTYGGAYRQHGDVMIIWWGIQTAWRCHEHMVGHTDSMAMSRTYGGAYIQHGDVMNIWYALFKKESRPHKAWKWN
jgi:hypothetical protein